jgi:hypothetical protein
VPHWEHIRNGHVVSINAGQDVRGRWSWTYTIDGDGYTEMRDRPLKSADAARLEAELDANVKADRLPAGDAVE